MADIEIRKSNSKDIPFIAHSWLHSYQDSYFVKSIPKYIYFKFHHTILEKVIARESTTTLVAIPKGEPDVILGYIVLEKIEPFEIFHYIYIKRGFSGFG